ncbi:MAG: methylated-DNA--[protein]-cysteine S-methyltransferase [Bacteroidota bacterium]
MPIEEIKKVYCTSFESKIGLIYIASTEKGVCKISLPKEPKKEFFNWIKNHFAEDEVFENKSRNQNVIDQLRKYFDERLYKFDVELDLIGSTFHQRVWKELQNIKYGETISYKILARRVGVRFGYRAVGKANGSNPIPIIVPCHRVINHNGSLGGYSSGIKVKEFLLRLEGAIII